MQALGWYLCPETAISWLTLYFQLASMKKQSDVLEPHFPQDIFLQMTRVGFHWAWNVHHDQKKPKRSLETQYCRPMCLAETQTLGEIKLLMQHWGNLICCFSCGLVHDLQCFCFYLSFWTSVCFTHTLWTSSITCWPPLYSHILFNRKQSKKFQVKKIVCSSVLIL